MVFPRSVGCRNGFPHSDGTRSSRCSFWEDYLARGFHCWHIMAQWGQGKAEEWKGLCGAAGAKCGTQLRATPAPWQSHFLSAQKLVSEASE